MSYYSELNKPDLRENVVGARSCTLNALSQSAVAGRVNLTDVLQQVLGLGLRMHFRKSAAFTLRLIMHPFLSLRWYRFLAEFAGRHHLGLPHDDILRKSIPNFFLCKASSRTRLALLQDHYLLADRMLRREHLQQLWTGHEIMCGSLRGKREHYDISLCLSDHAGARHEGAFTLALHRHCDQAQLCRMSFIFIAGTHGGVTLAIGGLQGAHGDGAKRAVIEATRDLHGVRPKDAMLLIAEGMAQTGGAGCLQAVSNAAHVINFRSNVRRKKMQANLNAYWSERGGEPFGRFGYSLPMRNTDLPQASTKRDLCKLRFMLIGKRIAPAHYAADGWK